MKDIVILGACRTAVGKFSGTLAKVPAAKLGETVIREAIRRAGIKPEDVDEVLMGCILDAGLGQNVARQAAMGAGIPQEVPATTINNVCGSGLKAVTLAAALIQNGDAEILVAGGTENMSAAPYLLDKAREGYRMGDGTLVDSMIKDGLWDVFGDYHMGITAENIAEQYGISREDQDAFALDSQLKTEAAQKAGRFKDEIVPVHVRERKREFDFDEDEYPRHGANIEGMQKLRPAFKDGGTVTAGNAAGINDAGAAVVLMKESKAKSLGLKPIVAIKGAAVAGVDPAIMGIGPIPAMKKLYEKTGVHLSEIGLIELNEAFAAQVLACVRELGLSLDITNVNGSGISLGHPIGATGCIITIKLINEMVRRGVRYGVSTLCIGGGQGLAVMFELCE